MVTPFGEIKEVVRVMDTSALQNEGSSIQRISPFNVVITIEEGVIETGEPSTNTIKSL